MEPSLSRNLEEILSILIVDDEPIIVELMQDIVDGLGYESIGAISGKEALNLMASGYTPSVAIVDLSMPEMSGIKLSRALLAQNPKLPIIITSGYLNAEEVDLLNEVCVFGYLQKPSHESKIAETIRKAIRSQTARNCSV